MRSREFSIGLISISIISSGTFVALYRPALPLLWPTYETGWAVALIAAMAIGLLEAAWTGPGRGGPTDTWSGIAAIYILLFILTMPMFWLIPLLAILEEMVHGFTGYSGWHPSKKTILEHWSRSYTGINLYPWITFPTATLVAEVIYRLVLL